MDVKGSDKRFLKRNCSDSILAGASVAPRRVAVYSPYGYSDVKTKNLLYFNGQRRDPITGLYLLGNGARAYSPVLMRFQAPDPFSPFLAGGINAYAYCSGDPVNFLDPSGYEFVPSPAIRSSLRQWKVRAQVNVLYRNAPEAKTLIDGHASAVASAYGGRFISAPIKSDRQRVIDNAHRLYKSDARRVPDIVRNTVVIDAGDALSAAKALGKKIKVKPRVYHGSNFGYKGIHVSGNIYNNVRGETQFHTRQEAFAILPKSVVRPVLGSDVYDRWQDQAEQVGWSGGLSHTFYEEFRSFGGNEALRDGIRNKSRSYWQFIDSLT